MKTFSAFRAQAGFAGYQMQPVAIVGWNSALNDVCVQEVGASTKAETPFYQDLAVTSVTNTLAQILAVTTNEVTNICYLNTSGKSITLYFGGAGSEVKQLILFAAPTVQQIKFLIPAGTRLTVRTEVTAEVANTGQFGINFLT